jgi:hypothetical protein
MYGSGKVPYLKTKFVLGEVGKQVYEHPSDEPADEMLVSLLILAKETDDWSEWFSLGQEMSSLEAQRNYLADLVLMDIS